jgi:hypothetical protein
VCVNRVTTSAFQALVYVGRASTRPARGSHERGSVSTSAGKEVLSRCRDYHFTAANRRVCRPRGRVMTSALWESLDGISRIRAEGGSRTHTPLRAAVFETAASAIPPLRLRIAGTDSGWCGNRKYTPPPGAVTSVHPRASVERISSQEPFTPSPRVAARILIEYRSASRRGLSRRVAE